MKKRSLLESFSFAINGFVHSVRVERNMKIHVACAAIAISIGLFLRLSGVEFIFLILAISAVMLAELLNTCIEVAIDHTTNGEKHPNVKIVKDIGAGAVLVASVGALIIGLILFIPKILS